MPEVGKDQQDEAVQEDDPAIARVGPEQRRADRLGQAEPDRAADQRAEQVGDLGRSRSRVSTQTMSSAERRADDEVDADDPG